MSDSIYFEGAEHIAASDAAVASGLTRDYIGRLCREEKLSGTRIGKQWYVSTASLKRFLVEQEFAKATRREELSEVRATEHKSTVKHESPVSRDPIDVPERLREAMVRGVAVDTTTLANPGVAHATFSSFHVPAQVVSSAADIVHRLVALTLAIALTFGTYSIVDPQYAHAAFAALRVSIQKAESVAVAVVSGAIGDKADAPAAQVAAAATGASPLESAARVFSARVDSFVYAVAFPFSARSQSVAGGASDGTVVVRVVPVDMPVMTAATRPPSTSSPTQIVVAATPPSTKTIIQRVVETQRILTQGGISQEVLDQRLLELDARLSARIAGVQTANSTQAIKAYQALSAPSSNSGGTTVINNITGTSDAGSLTGTLPVGHGGTGTSTAPTYGKVLLGNTAGGYDLVATSSLGIAGTGGVGTPGGSATEIQFNDYGVLGGNPNFTLSTSTGELSATGALFARATITAATSTSLFSTLARFTTAVADTFSATSGVFGGVVTSNSTSTNATSTNLYATSATLDSVRVGNFTGPVQAINGALSATSTISVAYGGTGTSSAPTYGKLLLGNAGGTYDLVSTSSLGIIGGGGSAWGSITGTLSAQTDLQAALDAKLNLSDWYSTTTSDLAEGTNLYFTTARATTSFVGNLAATTSVNSITTLANLSLPATQLSGFGIPFYQFFSATTTDALAQGTTNKYYSSALFAADLAATTSVNSIIALNNLVITSGQVSNFNASVNAYINASTTIPKTYTSNTFDGTQTFTNTIQGSINGNANTATTLQTPRTINGVSFNGSADITITAASSTLLADSNTFTGTNAFTNPIAGSVTGNAGTVTNGVYTTTFNGLFDTRFITDLSATTSINSIVTLNNLSLPYSQLTGTPSISGYPFALTGNATSTLTQFNGGLTAFASSTIGNGTQTGGLTISGTATTTNLKVTSVTGALHLADSTGNVTAYAGTTCSNQFIRSLNGAGAATCATVQNADLANSSITINGTSVSLGGSITVSSTTLLADSSRFTGSNTFAGNTTLAAATSSSLAVTNLGNTLVYANPNGSLVSIATSTLGLPTFADVSSSLSNYLLLSDWYSTTTSDLAEGTNLYFTTARATTSFVGNLAATTSVNSITTLANLSLPATQLSGFGIPFFQFFSATTTDALAQGTTNKYYSSALFAADLAATTSVNSIVTLNNLVLPYSQLSGTPTISGYPFALTGNATSTLTQFNGGLTAFASSTIGNGTQAGGLTISGGATTTGNARIEGALSLGTALSETNGGTGQATYSTGDILYASGANILTKLPIGSTGTVLKVSGGVPVWGTDITSGGGGGATAWATTTDSLAIYPTDTTDVLIVGSNSTSTLTSVFEVAGKSYFSNWLGIATTSAGSLLSIGGVANLAPAGSTIYSALTLGSLTATSSFVASGNTTLAAATSSSLAVTNLGNTLVYANPNGSLVSIATSTLGLPQFSDLANYLALSDWYSTTTSDIAEGTNLYFTTARATTSFIGNLAATTSVNSITTLNNLSITSSQVSNFNSSVNSYINSSTTIPKTYTANTFTNLQTFGNASSTLFSSAYASSTNLVAGTLSIANLSGFLKATAGTVSTALISLTSDISGVLGVTNGGTGWSSIQSGALVYGNGTSQLATTSAGTNGQVLALLGGIPTWTATTTFGTGLSYSAGNVTNTGVLALGPLNQTTTGTATFATSTTGSDFTITGSGSIITFNIPSASASNRGFLSATDWSTFAGKISSSSLSASFPLAYNSSTGAFTFSGLSTSSAAIVGNIPYFSSANTVANVATTTATIGSSLSYSGTFGALVGGANGTLSLNLSNPNTWTALQTFNYSSSTAYSSFVTASSTNLFAGTANLASLTTSGNTTFSNYINGALAVNGSGALYTFSTSTWSFASSTLLADSNRFTGANTFAGNTTLTNSTSTNEFTGALSANTARFGQSATSSFASNGALTLATALTATNGGTGLSTIASSSILIGGAGNTWLQMATSSLGLQPAGTYLTALGSGFSTTTLTAITFSTSTLSFNGLTTGNTISTTNGALTLTPTITGTLNNTGLTNSTISGIALGSNLANLTAANGTLTFSGSYNGGTAQTVALNLGNANTWTALQTFNYSSSTIYSSFLTASTTNLFAGSATTSNLSITGIASGNILKTTTGGYVVPAIAGTDYANFAYPFPSAATSTIVNFSTGLLANQIGVGTSTPFASLQIATTTGKNLVLSDSGAGTNLKHWLLSSWAGSLFIGTTTDTYATSSPAVLALSNSGAITYGGSVFNFLNRSTTTIANNTPYAWTIATSTTAAPLFRIDTTSGAEAVNLGSANADVFIGDPGQTSNLVFEENATIKGQTPGRTITIGANSDIINFGVNTGFGTSTPQWLVNPFSTTTSQLSLSAGAGLAQWAFRNAGGDFFLSTTTVAGTATTSTAAFSIAGSGFGTTTIRGLNISGQATSTSNVGFNLTGGCFAVGGNCIGASSITALGSGFSTTTLTAITFSTSTLSFNGLTTGNTISTTNGALTLTPTITGTLNNTGLTNSSVTVSAGTGLSGGGSVALGSSITLNNQFSTSSTPTTGNLTYWTGNSSFGSVATTAATIGSSLSYSGTFGALVGGANGTLSLNLSNANTWTALQTFSNASSTLFSSTYASSTNLFAGTANLTNLTTSGNTTFSNYTNGALAVNASGNLYTFSTSTWSFASSTLLADSSRFTGANTFAGNTTLTNATSSAFAITNLSNTLLYANASGSVIPVATSSLGINFSSLVGNASIAQGGTGTTTQVTNGVNYFDGTKITSGTSLTFDGTSLRSPSFVATGVNALLVPNGASIVGSGVASWGIGDANDTIGVNGVGFYLNSPTILRNVLSNDSAAYIQINGGTNGTTYFNGNIGIGTTTPYSKLTTWGTGSLFEAVTSASSTVFSIGQNGATTTNLAITNLASTLLKTNASGSVIPAVAGTDYANFAYPFPSGATTTALSFGAITFTNATGTTLFAGALTGNLLRIGSTATTTIDAAGNVSVASTLGVTGNTTLTNSTSTNEFTGALSANTARFGQSATSSFASNGALTLATALTATNGGTGLSTIASSSILIGGAGNTWLQMATSSLGLNFSSFIGTASIAQGGTGTTTAPQGQLLYGGASAYQSVATTTATIGSSLSYSGTFGALVGGANGTLALNLGNANTWTALQTFNYSSSTIYSSFLTASTTNLFAGSATTSNLSITGIASGNILKTTTGGYVVPAIAGTDYANFAYPFPSAATSTIVNFSTGLLANQIGVGTSTPFASLQVATTTGRNLVLSDPSATTDNKHWMFTSAQGKLYIGTTTDLFATSTPPVLTLTQNGYLALGNTNPGAALSVQIPNSATALGEFSKRQSGTGGAYIPFYGGAAGGTVRGYFGFTRSSSGGDTFWGTGELDNAMALSSAGPIQFGSGNTLAMTIDSSQNVGIGTNSPGGFKLNVNGTANISGNTTLAAATSSSLAITNLANTLLYANASGSIIPVATSSLGLPTFAYLFPNNATTTGLGLYASTTIGAGTQATGLTISGGATTTGNAYFGGNVGLGTTNPLSLLHINGGSVPSGTYTTLGRFDAGANADGTGGRIEFGYASGVTTARTGFVQGGRNINGRPGLDLGTQNGGVYTTILSLDNGNAGIGTTTPYSKLTTWGTGSLFEAVTNASSTVFSIGQSGATTTNLAITGITSSLLKTNANGSVIAAVAGTDYINSSFKDWNVLFGALAPTTTLGILVTASSTIGNGTQAGGLTVSGGATTTGNAYFAGNVGIGTGAGTRKLQLLQSSDTEDSGFGIINTAINSAGKFWMNGTTLTIQTNSNANQLALSSAGSVGLGTTSPWSKLAIHANNGESNTVLFAIASSTAAATTTLFSVSNTGSTTAANGFNITAGCFAVNGICITGGSGSSFAFPFTTGSNFGATTNSTTTNLSLFGGLNASSTIRFGNAGLAGFFFDSAVGNLGLGTTSPFASLQVATTTGKNLVLSDSGAGTNAKHWLFSSQGGNLLIGTTTDLYATSSPAAFSILANGDIGISSTTPWADLSVSNENTSGPTFAVGSSANATQFIVAGAGNVGVGTTSPWARLSLDTSNLAAGVPEFSIGSSTRQDFVISQAGYVGIGTTTPAHALDVYTNMTTPGGILSLFKTSLNDNAAFQVQNSVGAWQFSARTNADSNPGGFNFYYSPDGINNWMSPMALTAGGLVGIGTTTPQSKLDIVKSGSNADILGSTSHVARFVDAGSSGTNSRISIISGNAGASILDFGDTDNILGGVQYNHALDRMTFLVNGANAQTILSNGNVGIASTTPWGLLSINPNGITGPAFAIGSTTATSFIVDNAGRVGVGTTSPWTRFALEMGNTFTNTFSVSNQGSTTPAFTILGVNGNGRVGVGTSTPWAQFSIDASNLSTSPAFAIGSSTAANFVVTNGGYVGIGTTTPRFLLHASTTDGDIGIGDITAGSVSTDAGLIMTGGGTSTSALFTELDGGILSLGINVSQVTARNTLTSGGIFRFDTRTGTSGINGDAHAFVVKRLAQGSSVERNALIIDLDSGGTALAPDGGNVGIGTTTPWAKLSVFAGGDYAATAASTIFAIGSTTAGTATSTLFSVNSTGSTTLFRIPSSVLKTDSNGTIIAAVAGTDYVSGGRDWNVLFGALTPTTTLGILVNASSTIGNSTQTGGLTISGGATTTGNAYFGGKAGIGAVKSTAYLNILDSTGISALRMERTSHATANLGFAATAGSPDDTDLYIDVNGSANTLTSGLLFSTYSTSLGSLNSAIITGTGKMGIGTTSPAARLAVNSVAGDAFSLWVGSTTSPWLRVSNSGFGTTTVSGFSVTGSATSTSNVGFNLTAGCFAIGGNCLSLSTLGGTLGIANGGTNATALGSHMLLGFDGTSVVATSTPTVAALFATSTTATSTFAGGLVVGASALVYDYTTNKVGIGTASPGTMLEVEGANPYFRIDNTNSAVFGIHLREPGVSEWSINYDGNDANKLKISNTFGVAGTFLTIDQSGLVGIGTTSPSSLFSLAGTTGIFASTTATSTFQGGGINLITAAGNTGCFAVNGTCVGGSSFSNTLASGGTATTTFYNGGVVFSDGTKLTQAAAASSFFWDNTNTRLGLGTSTPQWNLQVAGTRPTFALSDASAAANMKHWLFSSMGGNLYIGTSTDAYATSSPSVLSLLNAGQVGIGTSTPFRRLSVTDTVANAQVAIAYDSTRYTQLQTDSTGGFHINPQGTGVGTQFDDSNVYVCAGGACPSGAPAGTGNLVVETTLGIGTSTSPWTLEVAGTRPTLAISDTGSGGTNSKHWLLSNQGGNLYLGTTTDAYATSSPSALAFLNSGLLGIGTSTPWAALSLGANKAIVTTEKTLTDGGTVTVSWKDGNQQVVTLGGNRTINFTNYVAGSVLRLVVCQDGTGSRTVTWDSNVLWNGGTAPTLTTTASKCDVASFIATGATSTLKVLGTTVLNF